MKLSFSKYIFNVRNNFEAICEIKDHEGSERFSASKSQYILVSEKC